MKKRKGFVDSIKKYKKNLQLPVKRVPFYVKS